MTKLPDIFKKPDYSHLMKEAESAVTPLSVTPPDFSIPALVVQEDVRQTDEEQLQLQFDNVILADRLEYAKACHEALRIHIRRSLDPLATAERFAEAYAEFRRLLLIRDFTVGFFQMRHEMRTLEQEIAHLQTAAIENPLLKEHLATLKQASNELRSQIKDKEELLASYRKKMKSVQTETRRFQRTNKEVADIIYNATRNHAHCATLRWSESKISRLNSSCKNGGLGKDGYPGNTPPTSKPSSCGRSGWGNAKTPGRGKPTTTPRRASSEASQSFLRRCLKSIKPDVKTTLPSI